MCLLQLTRARMTLPSADNERQRPELPSRFLLSTFTQLPRSIRCKRLRPPDTAINKESKWLACASKSSFPRKLKASYDLWRGNNPETSPNSWYQQQTVGILWVHFQPVLLYVSVHYWLVLKLMRFSLIICSSKFNPVAGSHQCVVVCLFFNIAPLAYTLVGSVSVSEIPVSLPGKLQVENCCLVSSGFVVASVFLLSFPSWILKVHRNEGINGILNFALSLHIFKLLFGLRKGFPCCV